MSWKNVKLIFLREVRDQLRDRRTLFMIAILPLLLYPSLGIGMVQMTVLFSEQPRTVVILGEEHLPENPQLISGNRFIRTWFPLTGDADRLKVFTRSNAGSEEQDTASGESEKLLAAAEIIREKVDERGRLKTELEKQSGRLHRITRKQRPFSEIQSANADVAQTERKLAALNAELSRLFSSSDIQVLILVPENFSEHLEKFTRQLAARDSDATETINFPRPMVVQNSADAKSMVAYRPVKEALAAWEDVILSNQLKQANLPESLISSANHDRVDLAGKEQIAANLWSKLFPALLVIMAVTGAFYPAIDLGAGEKERGTMETLLICPAKRSEIVMGKFFTILLFSISTALLNLVSMGFTGKYMASFAGGGPFARVGDLSLPPVASLVWVVVLLIPLSSLFSALCLSLATFARSTKEGQYYLTPLLMVSMGLTVLCLSPGIELTPLYSVMPVVGPALLLKEVLANPADSHTLFYAIPVLATSIGYSLLALWWAVELFSREEVLFREAERFEVGLWIRHLLRDKEPTPSFTEAGFCFVLMMLLQFGAMKFMKDAIDASQESTRATLMLQLLMIQQLVIIACPALFMGIILTTSVVRTFRLRLPNWRMLLVAAVLPLTLHPLSVELMAFLQKWFFRDYIPESVKAVFATMSDANHPWWFVLLAFAVVPAICEEVAFRGFILSGFSRSKRIWLAIVLASLVFGIIHTYPQQVFNASLLGMVLGLIAIRSNSLLPCIAFHMIYNSLQIVRSRIDQSLVTEGPGSWFCRVHDGAIRYQWTTLLLAAGVATWLLLWLVNQKSKDSLSQTADLPIADANRLMDSEKSHVQVG